MVEKKPKKNPCFISQQKYRGSGNPAVRFTGTSQQNQVWYKQGQCQVIRQGAGTTDMTQHSQGVAQSAA